MSAAGVEAGVLLAHKCVGRTSHAVVAEIMAEIAADRGRRRVRVCHGGALDPFAHGLLLLLAGPMTRAMDALHGLPKRYVAEVRWGEETDNGDLLGRVVRTGDATGIDVERLNAALPPFLGWTDQVAPATSNKRIDGERAYEKAHRGEEFVLPPSRVYLHSAAWLGHDLPRASRIALVCRGGYYVRSFVRDLGRAVGVPAHVGALERTHIGPWADPGEGNRTSIRGRDAFCWCPERVVTDAELGALRQAGAIGAGVVSTPRWVPPLGYLALDAPACAIHREHAVGLLRPEGAGWRRVVDVEGV